MTNDIARRASEHKPGTGGHFTRKYKINKPVYAKYTSSVRSAIQREKQKKGGSRAKKDALIRSVNPEWKDLLEEER